MLDGDIIANGEDVVLQLELLGKARTICVTRETIEDKLKLPSEHAATFSSDERCDFVRRHLPDVISAAMRKLQVSNATADVILISTGEM